MMNRVGKMFVAAMSLCMIVLIVTKKEEMVDIILLCDKPTTTLLINQGRIQGGAHPARAPLKIGKNMICLA